MSEVLKRIREFMEKEGIPGRDAYELPTSTKNSDRLELGCVT